MFSGLKIENGSAAMAQLPAREQGLVRALGLAHDAWTSTVSALPDGGAPNGELDMTVMSAVTDLWRAMKRIDSAIEALEMERMLSEEGPETEDISAERSDDTPHLILGEVSEDGGQTWRPMTPAEREAAEAEAAKDMHRIRESMRQQRANFNAIADGLGIPYPSEY